MDRPDDREPATWGPTAESSLIPGVLCGNVTGPTRGRRFKRHLISRYTTWPPSHELFVTRYPGGRDCCIIPAIGTAAFIPAIGTAAFIPASGISAWPRRAGRLILPTPDRYSVLTSGTGALSCEPGPLWCSPGERDRCIAPASGTATVIPASGTAVFSQRAEPCWQVAAALAQRAGQRSHVPANGKATGSQQKGDPSADRFKGGALGIGWHRRATDDAACIGADAPPPPLQSRGYASSVQQLPYPPPPPLSLGTSFSYPFLWERTSMGAVDICGLFNRPGGNQCSYRFCRYAHICAKCRKGPHPAAECGKQAGARPGRPQPLTPRIDPTRM